jgi:hypothetical protein
MTIHSSPALEQLPRHHHELDLIGACVDLGDQHRFPSKVSLLRAGLTALVGIPCSQVGLLITTKWARHTATEVADAWASLDPAASSAATPVG